MDSYLKQEKREMKRLKEYNNMLGYVADAQFWIPTQCACGGRIVHELSAIEAADTVLGKRFFTCKDYKADGLHFWQPWVLGVDEEIGILTRRVEEAEKVTGSVNDMNEEIKKLKEEVEQLKRRVSELDKLCVSDTKT